MASPRGFEPLTCSLGGSRAIQLCHGDVVKLSARDYTDTASSFHVKLLAGYAQNCISPFLFYTQVNT